MKKAFTLIEVMVSLIIFFSIVYVILFVSNNYKYFIANTFNYKINNINSSICIFNNGKNAYECVIDYNINDDRIIKNMKNFKIKKKIYKDNKFEIININNIMFFKVIL